MTSPVCPVCKVRLAVDGERLCMICQDREILERQTTLDQASLERFAA